jgi:hypothetical protein
MTGENHEGMIRLKRTGDLPLRKGGRFLAQPNPARTKKTSFTTVDMVETANLPQTHLRWSMLIFRHTTASGFFNP